MALFTVMYAFFSYQRYLTAYLGDPDYGLFNQSFWTTTQLNWVLYNTPENGSHFGTHNSPIFFLIVPIYALLPGMGTLLVVQAAAAALGGLAVYRLGAFLLDEDSGATLCIVYLLYHPMHGVCYDQFNELTFLLAPLLFAFYHLMRRRMGGFWLCIILAMACKEDVSILTAALGLYMIWIGWRGRDKLVWHGAALFLFSLTWFGVSIFVLVPYMRGGAQWGYFRERYGDLGNSFGEVVRSLVTRPWIMLPYLLRRSSLLNILELVGPLAFLPLLAPAILLVSAPTWTTLMLSSFGAMHNAGSRYMAPIICCVFAAMVVGIRQRVAPVSLPADEVPALSEEARVRVHRMVRWALVLTTLTTLAIDTTPMRFPFKNIPRLNAHERARNELADQIPPGDSVSTQPEFYGRLSSRAEVWIGYHPGSEWVLVDPTVPLWYEHARWNVVLPALRADGEYRVEQELDGSILLRRVHPWRGHGVEAPRGVWGTPQ